MARHENFRKEMEKFIGIDDVDYQKLAEEKSIYTICTIITPTAVIVCENGSFSIVLEFLDFFNRKQEIEVPYMNFNVSYITRAIKEKGGYIHDEKASFYYLKQKLGCALGYKKNNNCNGIAEGVSYVKVLQTFSRAGWKKEVNGELSFVSASKYLHSKGIKDCSDIEVEYRGKLLIGSNGNWTEYKDMIKNSIIDRNNVSLQVVLAMASAATLLWYFKNVLNVQLLNFIVHLGGDPNTGKSTSCELFASFSGRPVIDNMQEKLSMFTSFNSTDGALSNLDYNYGYPVAIDDFQIRDQGLKASQFYALAQGNTKTRLKSNGMLAKSTSDYVTGIMTSGESGIFKLFGENNEGLKPRIIEFVGISWTEDSASSDVIKSCIQKNYGFLAPLIADFILKLHNQDKSEVLQTSFAAWEDKFMKQAEADHTVVSFTPRLVKTLALFMVGLDVLGHIMALSFDQESVYSFLYKHVIVQKAREEQSAERTYQWLMNDLSKQIDSRSPILRISGWFLDEDESSENETSDEMIEDEPYAVMIRNTPKIERKFGGKWSLGVRKDDLYYMFVEQYKVDDFDKTMAELMKSGKLIYTETVKTKNGSEPRLDSKFLFGEETIRGYRFVVPDELSHADYSAKMYDEIRRKEE
jgi:hypothetical protein